MTIPIGVLGGGAFGRALAQTAARAGRDVILWTSREQALGDRVRTTRNYSDLADAELIIIAVPSVHVSTVASELAPHLDGSHLLVHVSRGLVGPDLRTLSQVLRAQTPARRVGALAGPLVAQGLADQKPSGAVVGSVFPEVADAVRLARSRERV